MIYDIRKITKDVRAVLDENRTDGALLLEEDSDTLTLDAAIKGRIVEGVRRVHQQAPLHLTESGHHFGDSIHQEKDGFGWILLPDDFMRLLVLEMEGWRRAVYVAYTPASPQYQRQHSRFAGIRGTAERPVCVLTMRPEGKTLEVYPCSGPDSTIRQALYLPEPRIDQYGGIDVCNPCYESAVYSIASLTAAIYGESELSALLTELARTSLQ
jgi:hypothetical protein